LKENEILQLKESLESSSMNPVIAHFIAVKDYLNHSFPKQTFQLASFDKGCHESDEIIHFCCKR
jgi:hypothetical protein